MPLRWVGYVGLVSFALAWIPQCLDTVRAGRCAANRTFIALAGLGSLSLTVYALGEGDVVFSALNGLTTVGAAINLYYSLSPRRPT